MKNIIFYLLIAIILVGCNAEPALHEFPVIETLQPIQVDSTGATFRGKWINNGKQQITSYGFVWSVNDPNTTVLDSLVVGTNSVQINFEKRIDFSLVKGLEYVIRTFARYGKKIIYGNSIHFTSQGSENTPWKFVKEIYLDGWFNSIGGSDNNAGHIYFQSSHHYIFNPFTNKFETGTNTPIQGNSGTMQCSATIGNIDYLFNSDSKNIYKLENNVWTIETQLPVSYKSSRSYAFSLSDSLLYFVSSDLYAYNIKSKIWTKKATFSWGEIIGCIALNNRAFALNFSKEVREYNPETNSWTKISTYPGTLRGNIVSFSYGNKIYFGLAYDTYAVENNWLNNDFWSFDISANKWSQCESFPKLLTNGGHNLFFFSFRNSMYLGYGTRDYNVWKFDSSKNKED